MVQIKEGSAGDRDINSMSPAWTDEHRAAANLEGWDIWETKGSECGPWQIQRIDEVHEPLGAQLESDDDALRIVFNGVGVHHEAARQFIKAHNKQEWDALTRSSENVGKVQLLHSHGYYAGDRDPKIKPEFQGRFMVRDQEDEAGFCIVGDDLDELVCEALEHLDISHAQSFGNVPKYTDGEVVGVEADGHLVQWSADAGAAYNSGETLEQFGVQNLSDLELQRARVKVESANSEEAPRWRCCNCMEPSPHPDNECVLHALLTVLRERETHSEEELEKIYINCNVDLLWNELGRIVNDLGNGRYLDDGQSLNSGT